MGEMADYYREQEFFSHLNKVEESTEDYHNKLRAQIQSKKDMFSERHEEDESIKPFINIKAGIFIHATKDGTLHIIKESDRGSLNYPVMQNNHLLNTIRYIIRITTGGVEQNYGWEDCDIWYMSEDEARKVLGLDIYQEEATKRGLTWIQETISL